MRNEIEKFHHTIGVLVKAYLNDTLVHLNCYACAVGNMIADGMKYKFTPCVDDPTKRITWAQFNGKYDGSHLMWYSVTNGGSSPNDRVRKEMESTGYTIPELFRIEQAFEHCDDGNSNEEYMFNGLMNVVDVLAEIHGIDLSTREETKKLFVKETID